MGILVILPITDYRKSNVEIHPLTKAWNDLQNQLSQQPVKVPVYFSFESQNLMGLYEELKQTAILKGPNSEQLRGFRRVVGSSEPEHMLVLNAPDAKHVSQVSLNVYYGLHSF